MIRELGSGCELSMFSQWDFVRLTDKVNLGKEIHRQQAFPFSTLPLALRAPAA